jgi:hypothetical protein
MIYIFVTSFDKNTGLYHADLVFFFFFFFFFFFLFFLQSLGICLFVTDIGSKKIII